MGGPIRYKGKHIATYSLVLLPNPYKPAENEGKFDLIFESLEGLEAILKAMPNEIIEVDGKEMPYKQFRKEMLKNSRRIYVDHLTCTVDQFSKGLQRAGLVSIPK